MTRLCSVIPQYEFYAPHMPINPLQSMRSTLSMLAYCPVLHVYTMYTYNFYIHREQKNQRICSCHLRSDPTSVLKHYLVINNLQKLSKHNYTMY